MTKWIKLTRKFSMKLLSYYLIDVCLNQAWCQFICSNKCENYLFQQML